MDDEKKVSCSCCHTILILEKEIIVELEIMKHNPSDVEKGKCVATWKAMDTKILNKEYLDGWKSEFCKKEFNPERDYFYLACRVFVRWAFGELGEGIRVIIPQCVLWRIYNRFLL